MINGNLSILPMDVNVDSLWKQSAKVMRISANIVLQKPQSGWRDPQYNEAKIKEVVMGWEKFFAK